AAKAAADAKALAQQEVQQYSDKQALLGRLQAAPKYQHAAREKKKTKKKKKSATTIYYTH
ncbi:hypothetical protein J4W14_13580, partial [Escherichia coli]